MLPKQARSRLVAGTLLMSLTVLAGCSFRGGDTPRIGMETDETDILFGRPEAAQAAEQEAAAAAAAESILEIEEFSRFLSPINFASSGPKRNCPEAPPLAAVSEESGTEVNETPQEGTHRWVSGGSYGVPGVPNSKIPISESSNHYIKPSQPDSEPVAPPPPGSPQSLNFHYQTIEPRVGPGTTGLWQFHWKVKSNSSVAQDPEGGLALRKIEVLDQEGRPGNTHFEALGSGLLFVPFPIRPGGTWNSASAGRAGGRSFRLSGQVLSRDVIDACGTLVQGWHVRSTFSEGTNQATLDYLIATQLGGQIISMNIDGFFLGTTFNPANFRLGQVDPGPLPSRFR